MSIPILVLVTRHNSVSGAHHIVTNKVEVRKASESISEGRARGARQKRKREVSKHAGAIEFW